MRAPAGVPPTPPGGLAPKPERKDFPPYAPSSPRMRTLLVAALLLTGLVALAPEATAHECLEPGPQINPDACFGWECWYYPEEGYIVCYPHHG